MTAFFGWRKRTDSLCPEICIGGSAGVPPVISINRAREGDLVSLQVIPRDIDLVALNGMSLDWLAELFPPPRTETLHV